MESVGIDRSHRHVCLTAGWLSISGGIALSVALIDIVVRGKVGIPSVLACSAALLPPIAVLLTVGVLQLWEVIKHPVFRIGYTCPRCSTHQLPYFRCEECAELIEDLGPTTFGVFRVRCGSCGNWLPTIGSARLRLDKICRNDKCLADLDHSELGMRAEYRIAIVGAKSSGKSNLMISSIWHFEEQFAPLNHVQIRFENQAEEAAYRMYVDALKEGRVMNKTMSTPVPRAFTLSFRAPDGKGGILYLYDAAGEDFEDEEQLAGHPIEEYDGVLLVVDPFAEEIIRQTAEQETSEQDVEAAYPSPIEVSEILGRLLNVLERARGTRVGQKFELPIAVVLTKVDACGLSGKISTALDNPARRFRSIAVAALHAEAASNEIRGFLQYNGLGNLVRIVDRFARPAYFAVSALGRSVGWDPTPFQPRGVVAPLLWLCYQTDALSDRDFIDRTFINAHTFLSRSILGRAGVPAFLSVWGTLTVLVALAVVVITTVEPIVWALVGIFPLTLVVWYIACIVVIYGERYD